MPQLSLQEFNASAPIALSVSERDALRASVPELRLEPAIGHENAYIVTPGAWVGSAMVGDLAIEIRPKLPIPRLMFLLSYTLDLANWGADPIKVESPDSLVEAVVDVFEWHLEKALRRGVLQGYRTEETALATVRGRIRFDEQLRRHFGVPLPVEVRFDEFTEDVLENRLLKAALSALRGLRIRSEKNRRALRRFEHVFDLVSRQTFHSRNVPPVFYTRLNEHYRGAVEWARMILRFASFESRHGVLEGKTLLFDMNAVFEEFVRTALREELDLKSREWPSGKECPPIFLDGDQRIYLEPDLSWWRGGKCQFVGDVKYKAVNVSGVKHPDLYQLLAYVTATELRAGLLVYASGEGDPAIHHVTRAGKVLHVRSLELSGPIATVRGEIQALAQVVMSMADRSVEDAA